MLPKKKVVRKNQNDANDKINMTNVDRNLELHRGNHFLQLKGMLRRNFEHFLKKRKYDK